MVNAVLAKNAGPVMDGQRQIGEAFNYDDSIPVGIAGCGGMMGEYHTEDFQSNPRISQVTSVYDIKKIARDVARKFGVREAIYMRDFEDQPYDPREDPAFKPFLQRHRLTNINGPNNIHGVQLKAIFGGEDYRLVDDPEERFAYCEKPVTNALGSSKEILALDEKHPGRIAFVAQNRLWDNAMEARYMILRGDIGNPKRGRGVYVQDWMGSDTPLLWRILMGQGADDIHVDDGGMGKLIDILYHLVDETQYLTGQPVTNIHYARQDNMISTRKDPSRATGEGSETGPFGGSSGEVPRVPVGSGTKYCGDDVLEVIVELENGAIFNWTIAQTLPGYKNKLKIEVTGDKEQRLVFNTDRPEYLEMYDNSNTSRVITRSPGDLTFVRDLPDWLREGLSMHYDPKAADGKGAINPPFGWFTPPMHGQGWREVHKRQAQLWGLYAQLVSKGEITVSERDKLYMVTTPKEGVHNMRVMKKIFEMAAKAKKEKWKLAV